MTANRQTKFGKKIFVLMIERDIYKWTELHRLAGKEGCTYSRQQMMNYVYGHSEAPSSFARCVVAAREKEKTLSEEEKREYAYAWAYEQAPKITHLSLTADDIGWGEEEKTNAAYETMFGR